MLKNIFLALQGTKTTLPWSSSARMLKLTVSSFQILFLSVNFNYFFWTFRLFVRFRWANLSSICHRVQRRTSSQCHGSCCRVRTLRHWDIGEIVTNLPSSSLPSSLSYFLVLAPVLSRFHKCSRWGAVDMFARKFPVVLQFVQVGSFFHNFYFIKTNQGSKLLIRFRKYKNKFYSTRSHIIFFVKVPIYDQDNCKQIFKRLRVGHN